jgi:hypothetical protein
MTDELLVSRIDRLIENLQRVNNSLDQLESWQLSLLKKGEITTPLADNMWGHINKRVRNRFREHQRELRELRAQVTGVSSESGNGQASSSVRRASSSRQKNPWAAYAEVQRDSAQLFDECLEFIGGLAFRRTGLDDAGMCELADALILSCAQESYAVTWNFLTVPSLRDVVSKSRARLSRIRFPEWTVWTLPFTAYPLGHEVIEEQDVASLIQDRTQNWPRRRARRHVHVLLAEIFGAYVMGPAYAHAGIQLRFDPADAYANDVEHPAAASRVYVVLKALKTMEAGSDRNWADRVDAVEEQWTQALGAAKPKGQMPDAPKTLDDLVEKALAHFELTLNNPQAQYSRHLWLQAQQLVVKWDSEATNSVEPDALSTKPPTLTNPRDVLNAAWLLRFARPDDIPRIETAATMMLRRLLGAASGGPGGLVGTPGQKSQQPIPASN